jgi:hypothetical protein
MPSELNGVTGKPAETDAMTHGCIGGNASVIGCG